MITETDLREVLRDVADEAPERCTTISPPRPGPRRFLLPGAAAAVVLVVAGVVAAVLGSGSSGTDGLPPRPAGHQRPSDHPSWVKASDGDRLQVETVGPLGPNAKQRHALIVLAKAAGLANHDKHLIASVVGTTYARLDAHYPAWFHLTPKQVDKRWEVAPNARIWVLYMRGHFEGKKRKVMVGLVRPVQLDREFTAALVKVNPKRDPAQVLTSLGKVVKLI